MEQHFIQARLLKKSVTIRSFTNLDAVSEGSITASCVFTGRTEEIEADAVVLVTSRAPGRSPRARACGARRRLEGRGHRDGHHRRRRRSRRRPSPTRSMRGAATRRTWTARRRTADGVPFKREIVELLSPRLIETPYDSRRAAIRNSVLPSRPLIGLSREADHRPPLGRKPVTDRFADFRVNRGGRGRYRPCRRARARPRIAA